LHSSSIDDTSWSINDHDGQDESCLEVRHHVSSDMCDVYLNGLTHSHLSMGPTSVYTPKYWTAQQKKDEFLSLPGPWTLLTLLSYHIANVWPNNGKRGSKVCPQCGVYSKPYLDWFMQETTGFTAVAKYRIKPWCFFPVNQFWGEHQNHIQQWKNIQQLDNIQL